MKKMSTVCSWSGGKDSCYALMKAIEAGCEPTVLLNMMNENGQVSRSHGLPLSILNQQAAAIGIPIHGIPATWKDYEVKYIETLKSIKETYRLEAAVFGDIDLEPHREWEEKVCLAAGLKPLLPLWQQDRKDLVYQMIDAGIKAIIVSCNTHLGETFLGSAITRELVEELEACGVDVCGENGEYHTAVLDCPLFSAPIELPEYNKKTYSDYCFIDWEVDGL
jgi:uncharacterized protein (TIGR00290 family)